MAHIRIPPSRFTLIADDLVPGKYYLSVQTDGENPSGWRGCDVEVLTTPKKYLNKLTKVRVQSALNVEFGFVDGLRRDDPHPVANIDSSNFKHLWRC